jgi:membrane associated rhomboid family serine protease
MIPIRDHNPSRRSAIVTWGLIALNIGVHTWSRMVLTTDAQVWSFYTDWALFAGQISRGEDYHTLVTSAFLHADWLHLAGNMLFLWIFGDNLEDELGHLGFLAFYLAAGVGAGLAQWAADPQSFVPMVGASGAIAGVMGGYLLLFPKAKVDIFVFLLVFIRIVPVPAWLMLALWFALQIANGVGSDPDMGGVAHWAHAGGFVVGLVLMVPVFLRRGGTAFWNRTHGQPPHDPGQWGPLTPSSVPAVRRAATPRRPWG